MKSFTHVVNDELGIHARPAGLLVKMAAAYASDVQVMKDGKPGASAKKLFAVMGLAVKKGEKVTVSASGADEDKAISELQDFFKKNL